jgi:PKD repeat protein
MMDSRRLVLVCLAPVALAWACDGAGTAPPPPVGPPASGLNVTCTASPTSGQAPLAVAFAASPSDVDSVDWSFDDGGGGRGAQTAHTYINRGVYVATATVRNSGREGVCSQTINVAQGPLPPTPTPRSNRPPNPDVRFDPGTSGPAPFTVTFNACPSYDRDNDQITFRIDYGDQTSFSGRQCSTVHTYQRRGQYRPRVCASDGQLEGCRNYTINVT